MKAKEISYLAKIVHALRCGEDGRHMLAAFSQKFMQSDKVGKYRSSLYEIPGIDECSSPLHLMALLARTWRCSPTMSWKSFAGNGLIVLFLAAVVSLVASYLFVRIFLISTPHAENACFELSLVCGALAMVCYFTSMYLHDRQILKIVESYGTMLDDFCESLMVADVRASWVVSAGWIFSQGQIDEVQKRAQAYLESWAMWVLFNEFLDSHSAETGIARLMFSRHYFALERIGLVHGGFNPFYERAQVRFERECAPGSLNIGGKQTATDPGRPYPRLLPERV